jgi:cell division protein FtsI (penicillin-binding protein 3)
VALVIGGIFLWGGIILCRLAQLQILQHEEYAELALKHQQKANSVPAPRGIIYDSHMDKLATSVSVGTLEAEPWKIEDKSRAAQDLASILNLDFEELHARITDPARRKHMVVKRRIDPKDEAPIEALGLKGVYLVEESMRVYPNRELASQTLGFVNMNNDGGAGLEIQYDRELKGTAGQISFEVDAKKRPFRAHVLKPPVQGHSLVLSIDKSIQYITERELAAGVENAGAATGVAIVMDSRTGGILALANYPPFNCNAYYDYSSDFHRNRAVADLFEPGSTFKVVVATAALEAGLTRPDEEIDCQMGAMTVGGHVFHDHKPYDLLTFSQIIEHSSNIGAAKLALRLKEQGLYAALRNFGFGARTGIDLPGEIIGLVRDLRQWSGMSIAAISFGQEIGVTSIQILTAVNAIANGGFRVRPFVVDRVIEQNGDLVRAHQTESTRIMRPETAAAVRDAFEGVVLRGTGRLAALEGYRAAGKTGTAQKIVDGRYSNTKYVASFIGFAPLPQPQITVLVQIDEPRGSIYGGDVSAPIFRKIAQAVLLQLHVPPDQTIPIKPQVNPTIADNTSEDFLPNATPLLPVGTRAESGDGPAQEGISQSGVITMLVSSASVEIPDFLGLSKRTVIERCQELGLRIQTSGAGSAVFQLPPPGTRIPMGDTCSVTFAPGKPGAANSPTATPPGTAPPKGQRAAIARR